MTSPFDIPQKKKAFPNRGAIIRSSGHRHLPVDLDALLEQITNAGGGGGGGVPVVDGATGEVVAIAHPDPVDGVMTYVDPETTVVIESSGTSRGSIAAAGGGTVRVVIAGPKRPTPEETPPPESGESSELSAAEAPETRPHCQGANCFVKVPCHPGGSTTTHIAPQALFDATNTGTTPLRIMYAGPMIAGHRAIIGEIEIAPNTTWPENLLPPPGTDTIFIACDGSGSGTFQFTIGVA